MNPYNLSLSVAEALIRAQGGSDSENPKPDNQSARPCITISREVGARGTTVAAEVGKRLQLAVYDRQILEKVAEEMRRPMVQLEHVDERPVGLLEDIISSLLVKHPVNPDTYLKYLIATVRGLGKEGGCILVGRGAGYILPPETTLRVRLVADLPDRIKSIQQLKNLSEKEARTYVTRTEEDRHSFVRKHFSVDVAEPHLYDVILNTSRVSLEECVEVIATLYRQLEIKVAQARRPAA